MKNIVILDVYANYIQSLLEVDDINISMAMVENKDIVQKCKDKFGDKIKNYYYRILDTNEEFDKLNKSDYCLTYDEIDKYRSTQLKCEHYLSREILDYSNIQYRYFMALRFWLDFFSKNKIDMVLDCHLEHGAIWDSIPIDIAISKKIPVYSVVLSTSDWKHEITSVSKLNDKTFVNLKGLNLTKFDLDSYLESLKKVFQKMSEQTNNNTKKKGNKINFKHFKNYTLEYFKYQRKSPIEKYDERNVSYKYWENLPNHEIYSQSKFINDLIEVYNHIAIMPDFNQKYIYVPLHQEPEASIMATAKLSNQIFIIKMLSEIIPSDWKIYVKEHPAQFGCYESTPYFYRNVHYFRNGDFYYQINKLKNVNFISMNIDGINLVKNCSAVCTITGSSLVQAMVANKPIISFGKALNFVELLKDTFKVEGFKDLKIAVEKIANGFKPNYSDCSSAIDDYVFSKSNYELGMLSDKDDDFVKIFNHLVQMA